MGKIWDLHIFSNRQNSMWLQMIRNDERVLAVKRGCLETGDHLLMTVGLVSFSCCHAILVQLRVGVVFWVKWNGLKWPAKPWSKDCCKSKTVNCMAHGGASVSSQFSLFVEAFSFCWSAALKWPSLRHPGSKGCSDTKRTVRSFPMFPLSQGVKRPKHGVGPTLPKAPVLSFPALLRSSRWLVKPGRVGDSQTYSPLRIQKWKPNSHFQKLSCKTSVTPGFKNSSVPHLSLNFKKSTAAEKSTTFPNNVVNSAKM